MAMMFFTAPPTATADGVVAAVQPHHAGVELRDQFFNPFFVFGGEDDGTGKLLRQFLCEAGA